MTVGERIKNLRMQKGFTQKKLATLCGLATGTIQQYELEKRKPKIETLRRIADALDVSLAELYDNFLEFPESRRAVYGASVEYLVFLIEQGPQVLPKTKTTKLLREMKKCLHKGESIEDADEAYDFFDEHEIEFSHELLRAILENYKNQSVGDIVDLLIYYISLTNIAQGKIKDHLYDLHEIPIYRKTNE